MFYSPPKRAIDGRESPELSVKTEVAAVDIGSVVVVVQSPGKVAVFTGACPQVEAAAGSGADPAPSMSSPDREASRTPTEG